MKTLTNKKLFLVDDDNFISEMYKHHLQTLGFNAVSTYKNGTEALLALTENPEIVFLDYQMDTINGFETLKKIKRFNPNILIVMVSGQEDMNVAIQSLKYGAFDYIIKGNGDLEKITDVLQRIEIFQMGIEASRPTVAKRVRSLFFKN